MRLSEDSLIATYFAPIAGEGAFGLRDDAAVLRPTIGHDIVVTTDAIVAGVHFFPDDPAGAIAKKALRVNLSDLAAKGADPTGFLLTLALPDDWNDAWLADFAAGLRDDAASYSIALLGGDTTRSSGALMISITALGSVPAGRMVPRTGIQAGDRLYVTGTIGDAALGLALRLNKGDRWQAALPQAAREHLLDRYLLPQPRLALRAALRAQANGGMDISDGLIGDLTKMLKVSGVTATIRLPHVPLSEAVQLAVAAEPSLLSAALTGGDDYEIIAAVPPSRANAFEAEAHEAGVKVAWIGEATEGQGPPVFLDAAGRAQTFARGSFSHF